MANEWHLHVSPPIFIESRLTRDFTFLVFSMSSIVFLHLELFTIDCHRTKTNVITTAN